MKNVLFLLVVFFFVSKTNAQQFILLDSVPKLITDTQSINEHCTLSFYDFNMPPDSLPLFYEKKNSPSDTASIWCKNINSLSPEKLFLQSGNGVIFRNPVAVTDNILWCVSNFQGQFDIYGFRYDNNFNITDTLRITNDTNIETSIYINSYYSSIYWIQKHDSLLLYNNISIDQNDSIYLGPNDTLTNHCVEIYPNDLLLYSKLENDSVHLFLNSDIVDTSGNVTNVNATINMTTDNFLWQRNDSVFSYDCCYNNYILINQNAPYIPYRPSIFDQYLWVKFEGLPLLAYTVKDSTNVLAISYNSGNNTNGNNTYNYFFNYNAPSGEAFSYLFPSNYEIQEIKMFPELSNGMLYIVIRVSVNNYERLYCLKASTSVGINAEEQPDNQISIYPNPSNDNFTVSLPENPQGAYLTIANATGQIIKIIPLDKGQNTYQFTEKLPAGIYFVKVATNKGTVVKKFVKQ